MAHLENIERFFNHSNLSFLNIKFYSQERTFKNKDKTWFRRILDVPEWPRKKPIALPCLILGHD